VATAIPSNQDIPLQANLPTGINEWPGPPTWTPDVPDQATIQLIDGSGQMRGVLHTIGPVTVSITSMTLAGSMDFTIDDAAPLPTDPIPIDLA
jgi:hypothetical protein